MLERNLNLLYCALFGVSIFLVIVPAKADYDDIRCRCTCMAFPQLHLPIKIYNASVLQDKCTCLEVVELNNSTVPFLDLSQYCLRCECKFDVRSTKTMQVVVLIYLSLLATLILYMIGMLVFELGKKFTNQAHAPLLSSGSYDSVQTPHEGSSLGSGAHVMRRLNTATEGWKKEVEKQRVTVFGRHDILQ